MRGHAFYESYFEHPCAVVVTEKDVLDTDIRGRKWYHALKRWYYSLFLLSYNHERVRTYYASSNALRIERAKQFRRFGNRIHPLSKFSNAWEAIMLIIVIANKLLFHHNFAMYYGMQSPTSIYMGIVLEWIMQLDLIVNLLTGYADDNARKIILDAKMGIAQYASTKLFLHFASALPLQTIMAVRYGVRNCKLCRCNYFVCSLKLWGIFGLVRMVDATSWLGRNRLSFKTACIYKFLRITILAVLSMIHFLDLTDTVTVLVMLQSQKIPDESYLLLLMTVKARYEMTDHYFMCVEFSIVCKSVLMFGYGVYGSHNEYFLDKIFSLLCQSMLSCLFFIWILTECYSIVHRSTYVNAKDLVHYNRKTNWLQTHQLSDALHYKIKKFYQFNMVKSKHIEKRNDLYHFLPSVLVKEIKMHCYFKYLRRIPYFSEWPVEVVEDLVVLLKVEVFLRSDTVAHQFMQGDGLVIVFAGVLAVYNVGQKEVGHLIDGDYFGELSLVTDKELRTSSVVAVKSTQILSLTKSVFRKYMRKHTEMFFEMRSLLLEKHNKSRSHLSFSSADMTHMGERR